MFILSKQNPPCINIRLCFVFSDSDKLQMDLRLDGTLGTDKCLDIKSPGTVDISNVIEKVVTCSYRDETAYQLRNILTLRSMHRGPIQVFDITVLGMML